MGSGITGVESHKKGMYLLRIEYLSLLLNSVYMWQLRSMKILRYFFLHLVYFFLFTLPAEMGISNIPYPYI